MDGWQQGEQYERYMGRWSRPTAVKFLRWLAVQDGQKWLDAGCGTGALSTEIVNHVAPASVAGIDASSGFIDEARRRLPPGIDLRVGDAQSLPFVSGSFDVVVSGIALNFVPDAQLAVREMRRVARTGGAVGVYLWDYNDGMEMIRVFWDVAVALDNHARPAGRGNPVSVVSRRSARSALRQFYLERAAVCAHRNRHRLQRLR